MLRVFVFSKNKKRRVELPSQPVPRYGLAGSSLIIEVAGYLTIYNN